MTVREPAFPDLEHLVSPTSVVLVGASDTPGSVGARLTENVIDHSSIPGDVYLVNARRSQVHGKRAYSSVLELPTTPDVAVIVVAASLVGAIVRDCAQIGIPFAAVLSSGFSEAGGDGVALERELREIADQTGIRIYGPNSPGISNIRARIGLNFSPAFAADLTSGPIGLATQGGGLGRTLLQASDRGLGVARWLSSGNEADLEISDFIHHLASTDEVEVIVAIIEGIRDGARFAAAALHARAAGKPIIAIKLGRSEYGRAAAMSHTTSMTGEAQINSAVFDQLGITEVEDISDLIDTAALFAQRRPGPHERVAIYTYSGGTAALAADGIGARNIELAEFDAATGNALEQALPRFGTRSNPVDTGTEVLAKPEMVRASLEPVLRDPNVGLTVVPVPIEMGQTTATLAEELVGLARTSGATVLPIWMTDRLGLGYRILTDGGVVPSRSLSTGLNAIHSWVRAGRRTLDFEPDWRPAVMTQPASASGVQGATLAENEAKALVSRAGIETPAGVVVSTADEAATAAARLGFPVAMKISSADIAHKTDIGGVALNVEEAEEARQTYLSILESVASAAPTARIDGVLVERMERVRGYEALLAAHRDPTFGPIITIGVGGVLVEIMKDAAHAMAPVSSDTARRLLAQTQLGQIMTSPRGRPAADLAPLANAIRALSELISTDPDIREIEINPLLVSYDGARVIALDALAVVASKGPTDD